MQRDAQRLIGLLHRLLESILHLSQLAGPLFGFGLGLGNVQADDRLQDLQVGPFGVLCVLAQLAQFLADLQQSRHVHRLGRSGGDLDGSLQPQQLHADIVGITPFHNTGHLNRPGPVLQSVVFPRQLDQHRGVARPKLQIPPNRIGRPPGLIGPAEGLRQKTPQFGVRSPRPCHRLKGIDHGIEVPLRPGNEGPQIRQFHAVRGRIRAGVQQLFILGQTGR